MFYINERQGERAMAIDSQNYAKFLFVYMKTEVCVSTTRYLVRKLHFALTFLAVAVN
jgi:hypothetical protein